MWCLVPMLTLLGLTLVAASPAAQQDGSLDSLINQAFPNTLTTQSSGDELDKLIKDVFRTESPTTKKGPILGTQNRPSKPTDCECVPYYQCKDGRILDNGMGIIDIRSGFDENNEQFQG